MVTALSGFYSSSGFARRFENGHGLPPGPIKIALSFPLLRPYQCALRNNTNIGQVCAIERNAKFESATLRLAPPGSSVRPIDLTALSFASWRWGLRDEDKEGRGGGVW